MILNIIIAVVALVLGGLCGYFIFRYVLTGKYNEMISAAQKEAEVLKEKKKLEVKEIFLNKKSELEKEVQSRNQKIQQSENRLKQRELSLNQRQEELGRRKQDVDQQQQRVDNEKKLLQIKQEELDKMQLQERAKLEELSGLSAEEAKNRLVESLKDEARTDAASYINEIMDEAKLNANAQAKKIVIQTIQRVATETAIENSVSVFHIDNDEVKGRIMAVKDVTSELLKQQQVLRLLSTTLLRLLSFLLSILFAVRFAVWLFISLLLTDVSTRHVSRKLLLRLRSSSTTRLSRQVSAQPSTLVYMVCILNLYVSSVR